VHRVSNVLKYNDRLRRCKIWHIKFQLISCKTIKSNCISIKGNFKVICRDKLDYLPKVFCSRRFDYVTLTTRSSAWFMISHSGYYRQRVGSLCKRSFDSIDCISRRYRVDHFSPTQGSCFLKIVPAVAGRLSPWIHYASPHIDFTHPTSNSTMSNFDNLPYS